MTEPDRSEPTARRYLKAAMEHMLAAGRSVGEFTEFAREKFGDNLRPYLHEFMADVRDGRIKIEGLTKTAMASMRGHHVTPEQREAMIRDAAYYRAQQRGFAAGQADEDWLAAEREVDARIELDSGVVEKGRKLLSSAAEAAELEFDNVRQAVTHWIEARRTAGTPAPAAAAPTQESTAKSAEAKAPAPKKTTGAAKSRTGKSSPKS